MSRDPAEEDGGPNVYFDVGNSPISCDDFLGLVKMDFEVKVGEWSSSTDEWGQPHGVASGDFNIGADEANSWVTVVSHRSPRGACNTIWYNGAPGSSGQIDAFVVLEKSDCPGIYSVGLEGHMFVLEGKGSDLETRK